MQTKQTTQTDISYRYRHVMLAVDNSDHSNRSIELGLQLAAAFGARITATHAYAAQLHDLRFKQMEGGLPEQFRKEDELERQRDVHDSLITSGLEIITDSYLDVVQQRAEDRNLVIDRKRLEGKNYLALLADMEASGYDLTVLGALGLGAVPDSCLGSVCERIARRASCDLLIAKDPALELTAGPIMVAVDGSPRSFAGLQTALHLSRAFQRPVEVVSAFDPYFHYVAFNSIAGVLSEEAGQVFRFQEQEQLHEEIIDSGLAKIYQAHLAIAEKIAAANDLQISTKLLAGKPFEVIARHVRERKPALLVVGRNGVHADGVDELGSNTANLMRLVPCHLLIVTRAFEPPIEDIAAETTAWTEEAEARLERAPTFVRPMARSAILRYALERGHTVITSAIVDDALENLLPASAMQSMGMITAAARKRAARQQANAAEASAGGEPTFDGRTVHWSTEARELLQQIADVSVRKNLELRAIKAARAQGSADVAAELVRELLGTSLQWTGEATDRLERVPEGFMRDRSRQRVEQYAKANSLPQITLEVCEAGLAQARAAMTSQMAEPSPSSNDSEQAQAAPALPWSQDARARMQQVPPGFARELTQQRIEAFARNSGATEITCELIDRKYAQWHQGSATQQMTMPWADDTVERIFRIPEFVRGMVIKEVERCAQQLGHDRVTAAALDKAQGAWAKQGAFHDGDYGD